MTEAIAIGGGLAGAAFAIELARHGRRVVILERTAGPHHKVCGEFLSAEAQSLLARLGVDVWELGARPSTHLGLEFGSYVARVKLPFRAAGLSRYRLDQALLDAAVRAGVEVRRGETVTKLEHDGATATVHTAGRAMPADRVALATGKHNLRGVQRPQTANIAFKMQVRPNTAAAAALDKLVHLSMFRGGYAGVCLVEDGIATICWVIERDALGDTAVSWDAHAEFLSRRSVFFAEILRGAQPLWDKPVAVASIPYGFLRGDIIAETIYPIGDQLVVIPSYTGDGTSLALYTGIMAAQAVLDDHSAGRFQAAMSAKLRPQIAWARLANIAFVNTTAQRVTATVARLAPWALPPVATFIVNRTRLRV